MKKITFFLIAMAAAFTGYAQFDQGRKLVGGGVSFTTTTNKSKLNGTTVTNGKQTAFSVTPNFGYFVIDNLAVGAGLEIGVSSYKPENSNNKSTGTGFVFTPLVRYYLPVNVFFHGEFGVGSAKSKTKNGNNTFESKSGVTNWALAAGYAIFLNESNSVAIEPMLGYGSEVYKDKDTKVKDIDNGLFLKVGFQIYLD